MCISYPHGLARDELERLPQVQESAVGGPQVGDLKAVAGEVQGCVVARHLI